jgi:hypothetical protein
MTESTKNRFTAVEALRWVLAVHFAEATPMAELEVEARDKLRAPKPAGETLPSDTLVRRAAWKFFEDEFGGWIRSVVRDEFKRMAN